MPDDGRTIGTPRQPIVRDTGLSTVYTDNPMPLNPGRQLPAPRAPIFRDYSGQLTPTVTTGSASGTSDAPRYGTGNPFEIFADALTRAFGTAQYNPPLQSQAYGYTPVSSSSNIGLFLILAAVGIGVYFYFRKS